ncbi:hypothetical protein, partial [Microbispora sp. NPDC046933]|uniref:hypothetical protein n=1 Tax=Microbispora sp. NPDC046933 TaxID=3155618 RepID=UPI0033DBECE3
GHGQPSGPGHPRGAHPEPAPTAPAHAFVKYQEDMNKKAYVIPTNFMLNYTPVNKRVVGMTHDYGAMNTWSEIGVSSAKLATK